MNDNEAMVQFFCCENEEDKKAFYASIPSDQAERIQARLPRLQGLLAQNCGPWSAKPDNASDEDYAVLCKTFTNWIERPTILQPQPLRPVQILISP